MKRRAFVAALSLIGCTELLPGDVRNEGNDGGGGVDAGLLDSGPPFDAGTRTEFLLVAAGYFHTCAVTTDGEVICWGASGGITPEQTAAVLGATSTDPGAPVRVNFSDRAIDICAGSNFTCVRTPTERVYCWGQGDQGQLGSGTAASGTPVLVGLPSAATSIACGGAHACAVVRDTSEIPVVGNVYCWGANESRQATANGNTPNSIGPFRVVFPPGVYSDVRGVACGHAHTCASVAIPDAEGSYCWGMNEAGQIMPSGSPTPPLSPIVTPARVANALPQFMALGNAYSCWLSSGALGCRGTGTITTTEPTSGEIMFSTIRQLDGGGAHACVLHGAEPGLVHCWGLNDDQQLADSGSIVGGVSAVSAGGSHTCAVSQGRIYCWGFNAARQAAPLSPITPIPQPTPIDFGAL